MYKITFNQGMLRRRLPQKMLLIMKLIVIIMTTCLVQVSAAGFAQKLNFTKRGASLSQIFTEIRKQTGYFVIYSDEQVDDAAKLDVNFKNTDLKDVMDVVGRSQSLDYSFAEKNISLKPKEKGFLDNIIARFQAIDVRGKVVDSVGNGLPGATVSVKNGTTSTSTDAAGNFVFKNISENAILVVSYIGYINKEVPVNKDFNYIQLRQSSSGLDEVQVIAYGKTSQRLSTGNVSSVKSNDIEKQPVNNPLLSLTGRIPGLVITQNNGFSGSGVSIRIQGQNSINQGSDPFYVLDGVPYTSQLLPNSGNILGGSGGVSNGNPFSFINPADIERIDVLKDADATAIYGSRAANGAILITTKKGKNGEVQTSLNVQNGVGKVAKKLNLLNTSQYLEMRNEALVNDGILSPSVSDYDINGTWDGTRYTDWQEVLIGGSAGFHDMQGSMSGGNEDIQFLVGGGYHKETTVLGNDFNDTKGSLHFNLTSFSRNKKFRFQLTGSYLNDVNKIINTDLTGFAVRTAPNAPSLYNSDGSINWESDAIGNSTWGFNQPIASLTSRYTNKTSNLVSNAVLSYRIFDGLTIQSNMGYTSLRTNDIVTNPLSAVPPEFRSFFARTASYGENKISSWITEPQMNYQKTFSVGKLDVLIGATFQQNDNERMLIDGTGYNSDLVLENINAAASVKIPDNTTIQSLYKYNALFGRINYNWDDRYILNLTARRDGSSRFGAENRFHNFGAVGAAWLFTNERFFEEFRRFLSFGKIRGSFGTTGNDQIGDYTFMSLYDSYNPGVPYRGVTGLTPRNIANPYLQWEKTTKLQVGLDLGFLSDRFLVYANYFDNRSSNQLLSNILATTAGFSSVKANFPATVQNSGWEFSFNSRNITGNVFSWTSSFNITLPKNRLIAFPDLEKSGYSTILEIGKPVNQIRLYNYQGVNATNGIYQFKDKNGNIVSDPTNDPLNKTISISTDPTLYGGFQNTLTYHNFQLDFTFQFVKKVAQSYRFGNSAGSIYTGNQPIAVMGRWRNVGDNANSQRFNSDFSLYGPELAAQSSNANYVDASYVRVRNAALSWQLPAKWCEEVHIRNAKLYVQGQNLLTFTKYDGLDPETTSNFTLPILRVITLGVQATF